LAIEGVTYTCRASDAWIDFQLSDASDPDYFVVSTDSVNGPELLAPSEDSCQVGRHGDLRSCKRQT
jgi:hypothetical protein